MTLLNQKILVSRAKPGKEKRMVENCDIEADVTFSLIGLCKITAFIEERRLGKGGHEEIDESIERSIWGCYIPEDLKLNKVHRGMCNNCDASSYTVSQICAVFSIKIIGALLEYY